MLPSEHTALNIVDKIIKLKTLFIKASKHEPFAQPATEPFARCFIDD